MTTIPITFKDETITRCEIIRYPDGQRNIVLDMDYYNPKYEFNINCRIKSFSDLELLGCLMAALYKHDMKINDLTFTYLFGMRSDRSFQPGMPNYTRDVLGIIVSEMIFRFRCRESYVFYPHNFKVAEEMNCRPNWHIDIPPFYSNCILIGADENSCSRNYHDSGYFIKSRNKHAEVVIESLHITDKDRMENIKSGQPILIFDDLCDGGATFIKAAEYLKEHFPQNKRYLFIAHALFTRGIDIVADHYDHIICTNSYQDLSHPKITQIKVI